MVTETTTGLYWNESELVVLENENEELRFAYVKSLLEIVFEIRREQLDKKIRADYDWMHKVEMISLNTTFKWYHSTKYIIG